MKRRTFLQRIGFLLAVLGITEAEWLSIENRYQQALAQPSTRKLALLIGINQYQNSPVLNGCLTDVELQKELLIHRFGFQPSDILSLTNEQATRESIESAFLEHLVKQAKPNDVVLFHFSGYGSRVRLETSPEVVENALVTANTTDSSILATKNSHYLLAETLMLMLRSLSSQRVTTVLDTSYYFPTSLLPTGLRIRTLPMPTEAISVTKEPNFLTQLQQKAAAKANVTVLSATWDPEQVAQEIQLSGFSAGLFTYALTQSLWEITPATKSLAVFVSRVGSVMQQLGSTQQPGLLPDNQQHTQTTLSETFAVLSPPSAQGVVTAVEEEGKTVSLWLAGLPPQVLEYYGAHSRLTLLGEGGTTAQLVLRSRSGLTAKAHFSTSDNEIVPQVGQLVQEAVRILPRNINLTVALDTGLQRIERVDATSAFATVEHVTIVVAGEQPADYVFGELPDGKTRDLIASTSLLVSPSRYGLFSLGSELIPSTIGEAGEAVKLAVQRLKPTLQTLLAAKLWRLTDNEGSSCLSIKATLEIIDGAAPTTVMQRETMRTATAQTASTKQANTESGKLPFVPIGSKIQYRIENTGNQPLYFMLLGLNGSRNAIALYPWQKVPETDDNHNHSPDIIIAPGETLILPQSTNGFEWVIQGPDSVSENQLIFSTAPFTQTRKALETDKHLRADRQRIQPLLNPLEVANALLQDLHNASLAPAPTNLATTDSYVLDVNCWASLSFIYQVT
jgi:uncharacterized caspase-like protein